MSEEKDTKATRATPAPADPVAVVAEALKAAGFAHATVRKSDGVHDAVIVVTLAKGT